MNFLCSFAVCPPSKNAKNKKIYRPPGFVKTRNKNAKTVPGPSFRRGGSTACGDDGDGVERLAADEWEASGRQKRRAANPWNETSSSQ